MAGRESESYWLVVIGTKSRVVSHLRNKLSNDPNRPKRPSSTKVSFRFQNLTIERSGKKDARGLAKKGGAGKANWGEVEPEEESHVPIRDPAQQDQHLQTVAQR
jgi:hypothetical protein